MRGIVHLLFFITLMLPNIAQASSSRVEAKFGPEWTFSIFLPDADFEPDPDLRDFRASLINKPRGAYRAASNQFLQSPSGDWQVRLVTDPGVYEVQTTPMTVREFAKYQKIIQRDIFDNIKKLYTATPLLFVGGGHINVGMKEFVANPNLLRNFLIDFYNHNELSLGIFGYDTNNALSFSMLSKDIKAKILNKLNWFTREAKFRVNRPNEILDLMDELFEYLGDLQSNIYDEFFQSWQYGTSARGTAALQFARYKFVDLNYKSAEYIVSSPDSARLEIRSVRPQASADVYRRQIQLLQARLDFLAKQDRDIVFKPRLKLQRVSVAKHKLTPPVEPQEALQSFYIYVTESGQKWMDHRDYIWPMWITGGELEKFENSIWFLEKERTSDASCRGLLR
jgi:hypothetical protein